MDTDTTLDTTFEAGARAEQERIVNALKARRAAYENRVLRDGELGYRNGIDLALNIARDFN